MNVLAKNHLSPAKMRLKADRRRRPRPRRSRSRRRRRRRGLVREGRMGALPGRPPLLAGLRRCRGGCCCWGWRRGAAGLLAGLACLSAAAFLGSGGHEELLSRALPLLLPPPGAAGPPGPPPPPPLAEGAFVLEPGACGGGAEAPFLLALVASAAGHARARAAVRRSWGGARRAAGLAVRTVFVVGLPAGAGAGAGAEGGAQQAALAAEAARHGDVLQGRFADTYANLTRKTLALLGWAASRCPAARFVLKADDDVFVNLPALAAHLAALPPAARHYLGRVHWRVRPQRAPAARHHVPAALYAPAAFPPYCSGTAYVLSAPAVAALLAAAPRLPLLPVEDAFVGLAARAARLAPRHLPRMAGAARLPPDPCCYRHVLFSVHGVAPAAMERAWQGPAGPRACRPLQRALGLLRCRLLAWWAAGAPDADAR
ncbi:UNVERIFIED_CONTAM: hypothetical protein K2H54_067388 [Gekko kuhli]